MKKLIAPVMFIIGFIALLLIAFIQLAIPAGDTQDIAVIGLFSVGIALWIIAVPINFFVTDKK